MNEQDKKILHVKRLLSSESAGIRTLNEGQHFKNAENLCKLMRLMAVTSRLLVSWRVAGPRRNISFLDIMVATCS